MGKFAKNTESHWGRKHPSVGKQEKVHGIVTPEGQMEMREQYREGSAGPKRSKLNIKKVETGTA